jgi:diaminopimelate epimerase
MSPILRNAYFKGHGLGNDYIALDPDELDFGLTPKSVRALCDRHRGIGGDGVLALEPSERAHFGLRIHNPDGSAAEKSGNGLRIFASYLSRPAAPGAGNSASRLRAGSSAWSSTSTATARRAASPWPWGTRAFDPDGFPARWTFRSSSIARFTPPAATSASPE